MHFETQIKKNQEQFSISGHPRAIVEFCYQEEWKKEAVDLYVTYNGGRV